MQSNYVVRNNDNCQYKMNNMVLQDVTQERITKKTRGFVTRRDFIKDFMILNRPDEIELEPVITLSETGLIG